MAKSKSMCLGCRDNYYNGTGAKECWSFAKAKVVKRVQVGTWQNPPYVWRPIEILSCYRREGSSFLERTDCRVVEEKREKAK